MAVNKLKVVVSILKEISDKNSFSFSDYGIEKEEFIDILEAMQDEGLITGVRVAGAKVRIAFYEDAKLTIKGMEYLNQNSALMKTYKGLKEVREWLPF